MNFWEEGLQLCVQSKFECFHGCSGHNILRQLVPVRDFSNAECMLAATSLIQLLMNLQSMTSKPSVDGGGKGCVKEKVEEAYRRILKLDVENCPELHPCSRQGDCKEATYSAQILGSSKAEVQTRFLFMLLSL